jgi:hypothetical protein
MSLLHIVVVSVLILLFKTCSLVQGQPVWQPIPRMGEPRIAPMLKKLHVNALLPEREADGAEVLWARESHRHTWGRGRPAGIKNKPV